MDTISETLEKDSEGSQENDKNDVVSANKCISLDMALNEYAKNGNINEMRELLSSKSVDVNAVPSKEMTCQGLSALHLAVRHKHTKCVKLLLAYGADVNQTDKFGFRPIHDACLQGNFEVLQLLLKNGAIIDGIKKDGLQHITPLLYAARENHLECVRILSKKHTVNDLLLWDAASKRGNTDVLGFLSNKEEVKDEILLHLVHNSALGGQTDFIRRVLHSNKQKLSDKVAQTALLTAAQHGHVHYISALLEHGIDPNIADENKVTALHNAARYGQVECITELIQNGANTEALTDERWTALHVAVRQCQEEAVATLIEMGSLIDEKGGPLDETPLHLAVIIGDIPVLKKLLEGNPNLLVQNKNGKSVLQMDLRKSVKEMIVKHSKS